MLIGAVADDLTGATDLCLTLSRAGLSVVQVMGVPTTLPQADAVVIALKSRTIPAADAVKLSTDAARFLLQAGAQQILFKYCSTFDSTDHGNIGPVTEALLTLTQTDLTIACPAYPANKRTVYQGHLFIGDQLLSDSPMKHHPLTPMHDANLVRVLQRQTSLPIGLLDATTIAQGPDAITKAYTNARAQGIKILICDTLTDADLMTIGAASATLKLITGGSAIAMGLAANFPRTAQATPFQAPTGRTVILAGSCSSATLTQIATAQAAGMPTLALDPTAILTPTQIAHWATNQPQTALIYSTTTPEALTQIHATLGRDAASHLIEQTFAQTAWLLTHQGFTRFIIAGGETSGGVVAALNVTQLTIGPEIAPGVPWTRSTHYALALKSGNFGGPDFFARALAMLDQP